MKPELLPELSWDFEWGTNMHHALLLACRQLARQSSTKRIIMVTDGEPTAHIENGGLYFEYPPSAATIAETLKEVMRCTRAGIRINTFMLDESRYLRDFVERMTKLNNGRAFFTSAAALGVEVTYQPDTRTAELAVEPQALGQARVGGGTCGLTQRARLVRSVPLAA